MASINHLISMKNDNLYSHYQKQFIKYKDKVALRLLNNETIKYSNLENKSAKIANYLVQVGVSVGDRVSVQVHKSPELSLIHI